MIVWGNNFVVLMFVIVIFYDEKLVIVGNGSMVVIVVIDFDQVNVFYVKVIELGGIIEGELGVCMDVYYCVYVCDFDGNKLNFFCMVK